MRSTNDLVDEINLFTFPVVVGQGTLLFPNTGPNIALELGAMIWIGGGVMFILNRIDE